jgi:hypothetical protein
MFQAAFNAMPAGASLDFRVDGHICVAGRVAVMPFLVDWRGPKRTKRIQSIGVIEFDDQCLISSLKAYWGVTDVSFLE